MHLSTSFYCAATSIYPRQDLLQVCKELLPPVLGALVGLLLIRPEARLLHAQVGPRARRAESPSNDTLETIGRPCVIPTFTNVRCLALVMAGLVPAIHVFDSIHHSRRGCPRQARA